MIPTKNNLIIKPIQEDIVTDSGIILKLASDGDRSINRGEVISVGKAVNDGIPTRVNLRPGSIVQYFDDVSQPVIYEGDRLHIVNKKGVFLLED